MNRNIISARYITSLVLLASLLTTLLGCGNSKHDPEAALATAESFISTFYSWDAQALKTLMKPSPEADNALYYQAWALAANYAVKERHPCTSLDQADATFECRITVTDDFGRALGYTATDTFRLGISGNRINSVTFEGDDPPVFEEVFGWLMAEQPELFAGVCKDMFAGGSQPAECARAIAAGAAAWARVHPRSVKSNG